jgi:hypothetical protein
MDTTAVAPRDGPSFAALMIVACLTVWGSTAQARTLSVCKANCTYSSVQRAIDAAASGDTINVGAGTYFENLVIAGKKLTLIGAGEDLTVLDGRFGGAVIHLGAEAITAGQSADLTLYAVTVTHGGQSGIAVHGGSLNLQNSAVVSNRQNTVDPVCGEEGGGIVVCSATATIGKSVILHNRTTGAGGGIAALSESSLTITDSTISRNTAGDGGGIHLEQATAKMTGSSLSDNTATGNGGAIYIAPLVLHAPPAGFLAMDATSVVNNHAQLDGGGIWGVATFGRNAANISNSVIGRNTSGRVGGGLSGTFTFDNVFVVQNAAGASGGGIQLAPTATSLAQVGSTFAGNAPDDCAGPAGACPPK